MKKPYGMPAALTIWNEDETFNEKGMERYLQGFWIAGLDPACAVPKNIAMHMESRRR